ncbi:MAG TPA: peptidyl-prolyl cis-trans isomerase [Thermodesulfobacteriota bacterium]|nr:peptidyl-prolyl cis-trans isomerase [Thermodesulfobacteriota bacterium]
MKKFPVLLILCILLFFLGGCGQRDAGLPGKIIAQVNEEQIPVEAFDKEFKELILEPGKEAPGAGHGDLKQAYLDQVIERKILVQEARRLGIKVSPEELNQAVAEIKKDYSGGEFGETLGLKGVTLEEWKVRLEEKLLAEKVIRTVFYSQGKVDEKEALRYYEGHRSLFQIGQKVKVRQIVVADGEEAIQILKRLKRGENFEKVASEKSIGPEKVQGGDLGYFGRGEKPNEFDYVFSMEVGAISEVIKSPYGYHIFKLEEKTEPRQISFEEAKSGILQDLEEKKGEENYQKWFKSLKVKARVKINKKWLRS